jgi:membrane protease YdiL (CAAX protease family)
MSEEADVLAALLCQTPPVSSPASPSIERRFRLWLTIGTGVPLGGLWIWASVKSLSWAAAQGWLDPFNGAAQFDLLIGIVVFGGLFLIALLMTRLGPVPAVVTRIAAGRGFAIGVLLGVAGLLASLLMSWVGGHVRSAANAGGGELLLLMVGGFLVMFEAAVEEYVFRAWLQLRLQHLLGGASAVLAASLIFSLLHLIGGSRSGISLANIFLAGVFFGLLALRTGGIAASIGAHFGWNWAETTLLGLVPNPGRGSFGAVFDFDLSGSALWGGSSEGLNAAVAVSFTLVALILPLLAQGRRPQPA